MLAGWRRVTLPGRERWLSTGGGSRRLLTDGSVGEGAGALRLGEGELLLSGPPSPLLSPPVAYSRLPFVYVKLNS